MGVSSGMSSSDGQIYDGQPSPGKGRPLVIGLSWHSLNSGNLGVGALTLANIAIVRAALLESGLQARFVIMAPRDRDTPALAVEDAEIVTIDRKAITSGALWHAMGQVDCVLDIGAGDSFADIYGPKRFAFLWLTKAMAIARRVPLLLSPQTIGPFTKPIYRMFAAWAIARSQAVFARDETSRDVACAMAPEANVKLSLDVAFVLPFEDRSGHRGGARLRIGVNASGLLLHEAESGRNRFGLSYDYAAFTRSLLSDLSARDDVEVHLISHATSNHDNSDDDGAAADCLAAEFPGTIRVPNFPGPSEAKAYISSLDFLVAARMHACIGAFSAGTPVVPVSYSRKFSGLFGLLGYDAMVPVQGFDATAAHAFVIDAIANRSRLADGMRVGMSRVSALLDTYRDELQSLFINLAERP